VRVNYEPDSVRLTIEDFGLPGGARAPGSAGRTDGAGGSDGAGRADGGYGLTGMRERAELLGGTLTAGATAEGFWVELRVPA
jgi:hypothetical protein